MLFFGSFFVLMPLISIRIRIPIMIFFRVIMFASTALGMARQHWGGGWSQWKHPSQSVVGIVQPTKATAQLPYYTSAADTGVGRTSEVSTNNLGPSTGSGPANTFDTAGRVPTATGGGGATTTEGNVGATGSPPSGGAYTGDITYYSISDGPGSCGKTFNDSDLVCALSTAMMGNGPNPNTNPKCYTSITLTNPDNPGSWQAQIVSTCEGCAYEDVDLSPALFQLVAPTGDGRVHGISWSFDS